MTDLINTYIPGPDYKMHHVVVTKPSGGGNFSYHIRVDNYHIGEVIYYLHTGWTLYLRNPSPELESADLAEIENIVREYEQNNKV